MPNLINAFKQMDRRGLIAHRKPFCAQCGPENIMKAAFHYRREGTGRLGFVHCSEITLPGPEDSLLPLAFGMLNEWSVSYHGPESLGVAEIVSECLVKEGIWHEWDKEPGSPIVIKGDLSLRGLPKERHCVHVEGGQLVDSQKVTGRPSLLGEVFDVIPGNALPMLNWRRTCEARKSEPLCYDKTRQLQIGDSVALMFCVRGALSPSMRKYLGRRIPIQRHETCVVEITSVSGQFPYCVYIGKLVYPGALSVDERRFPVGSLVSFTLEHTFPRADTGAT